MVLLPPMASPHGMKVLGEALLFLQACRSPEAYQRPVLNAAAFQTRRKTRPNAGTFADFYPPTAFATDVNPRLDLRIITIRTM